ncbi:hypothetical protein GW17_00015116 [Ensete ventricosum]|nr:hypothetical protein GW17_00015116 [Ensete ventricosum]
MPCEASAMPSRLHDLVSSPHMGRKMSFSSPNGHRSLFSPQSLAEASFPCGRRIGIIEGEQRQISKFSLLFLLPRLIQPDNWR